MKKTISTIFELLTHPKNVVDSFLTDQNRTYSHPFAFMVSVSLPLVVVLLLTDWLFLDLPGIVQSEVGNETIIQIQAWIETVSRGMVTIFLPLSAVILLIPALSVSGLIFFRNELNGFYENLILSTYTVSAAGVFCLLWFPVLLIFPDVVVNSSLRITIAITMTGLPVLWMYQKFFPDKTPISLIRQLSTAASGYILFIVILGIVSGILGYMIFAVLRIAELSGQ